MKTKGRFTLSLILIAVIAVSMLLQPIPVSAVTTLIAYDSFTRDDGAIGSTETTGPLGESLSAYEWTGSTWTISANKSVNAPTLGSELLVDGGFETWTSSTNLTNWNENIAGTGTINQETSVFRGGANACRVDIDAGNNNTRPSQGKSGLSNRQWVIGSIYVRSSTSGKTARLDLGGDGSSPLVVFPLSATTYEQQFRSWRTDSAGNIGFYPTRISAASSSIYWDDASLKAITGSSLFVSIPTSHSDVIVEVNATLTAGTQAGLVVNLDSAASPSSFVIAYHDGANAILEKNVSGTYTTLINTAVTYVPGAAIKVVKTGTTYQLFYNGTQRGTDQTISDASIVDNTRHGLFSTYSGNILDDFKLSADVPPTDTPTNTATATATDTATNTPTDTATFTLTPSDTPTGTLTPSDTPTATETFTSTPSPTPTGPTSTPAVPTWYVSPTISYGEYMLDVVLLGVCGVLIVFGVVIFILLNNHRKKGIK